jgi:DNA-binding MarR family transcriptional regulator
MANITEYNTDESRVLSRDVLNILRQIIQAVDLHSRYLLRRYGLTVPQLIILQEIFAQGEISIGKLARCVSLSQSTVTTILSRLEKQKLVSRRRSESDRRRVFIQITPEGEQFIKSAPFPLRDTFIEQFDGFQEWERSMILSALQRLFSIIKPAETESLEN